MTVARTPAPSDPAPSDPASDQPRDGEPGALTPELVAALQAVVAEPCVSVLMTTELAARMTPADADRLRHLALEAAERVPLETPPEEARDLLGHLEDLVDEAQRGPTAAAVALYATATRAHRLVLPVAVRDRVVVDPTFATRDLLRALHRVPRHVLLVLTADEARLLEGAGAALAPAPASGFPLRPDPRRDEEDDDADRPGAPDAATRAFLRTVDRALGVHLALRPTPLVLAGPEQVLGAFQRLSGNLARLAGTIVGDVADAPASQLRERVRPVLEAYLHSRQQEALDLIEQRAGAGRVVSGVPACWFAAREESPEVLVVEDDLYFPAHVSPDGDELTRASDVEDPEVVDDAVDELIELVLRRGGWVALAEPGALSAHDGAALATRRRR